MVSERGYPVDTTECAQRLLAQYRETCTPLPISFRSLVSWMKVGERATHYLHPYPAKLLPHIAHYFLASDLFCGSRGQVLDPFGGTGTVALEAMLSGRTAIYADANPLACLIARAKTDALWGKDLRAMQRDFMQRFRVSRSSRPPEVVNIDKWFEPKVIGALCRLRAAAENEDDPGLRRLLDVTFSATVRRVSNADPRLSVPVLSKTGPLAIDSQGVLGVFQSQLEANIRRVLQLRTMLPEGVRPIEVASRDARSLGVSFDGSVDLVITSPPYAGAQKYVRSSSLCLGWLGLASTNQLKPLENESIGREHLSSYLVKQAPVTSVPGANLVLENVRRTNPTRAAIAATYINEMESALTEMSRVLRIGGRIVLIIGNNVVCGQEFMSSEYLSEILQRLGFRLELALIDDIKSRGLMTKRNKTANLISREWVLIFRKDV